MFIKVLFNDGGGHCYLETRKFRRKSAESGKLTRDRSVLLALWCRGGRGGRGKGRGSEDSEMTK